MDSAVFVSASFQQVLAFADTLSIGRAGFLRGLADGVRGSIRASRTPQRSGDWPLPEAAESFCATSYAREPILTTSVSRAATLLTIPQGEVRGLIAAGRLLAVLVDGEQRVPLWQFTEESPRDLLPGLEQILSSADGMDWRLLSAFMTTPQRALKMNLALNAIEWAHVGGAEDSLFSALEAARD
ncbi:hypothetical protein GCM10025867_48180 (plasmid) [Frondihabitans sucicola]|uniref:DNA-binding protein n=1 Tax=Frondihabitans sucicola TaxID=1268041 RepID=A0ABM8GVU8_9MICO|nr:hypothetical protein [Frondihabitans sucicola]BDZ50518.1 hypothetical protein GCM10025867_27590 [Frondihabitans sucicola]BDZ52577.1 hypothetical protein GCM10025867_48180 [Frondihabitans sucicola]